MVNLNFKKFRKVQQEHKAVYLGGENQQHGLNDEDYNDQDNTDKSSWSNWENDKWENQVAGQMKPMI